jgi:predicted nucleic acid-binding protein
LSRRFGPVEIAADVIVVDASAVLAALVARPVLTEVDARLGDDGELQAPHLLDIEVLHVLRRLVRTRALSEDRAASLRSDFAGLVIQRYPHQLLADRIWDLRSNLTAYDAAYIALSEQLRVPLVTCDERLVAAPHEARVEVYLS